MSAAASGRAREFLGEHEVDDSFCRRRAAVKQYGAEQRSTASASRRRAARRRNAARRHRASNCASTPSRWPIARERRLFDERRASAAQVAFGVVGAKLEEPARDGEVQERVAEILEALVVVLRRAAMRQRQIEERRIFESVVQLRLRPAAAISSPRDLDLLVEDDEEIDVRDIRTRALRTARATM